MFAALRKHRGYVKFRRNRAAMVALVIIALYAALAGWVIFCESVRWAGRQTGLWSVSNQSVLGLLTAESVSQPIGADSEAGLFLSQSEVRRVDQVDYYLKRLTTALDAAERREVASPGEGRTAFPEFALGAREIADRPPAELRARLDAVRPLSDELTALKLRRIRIANLTGVIDRIPAAQQGLNALGESATEPDRTRARNALGDMVEDAGFAIQDLADSAPADDPLKALDPLPLLDAGEAIRSGKPDAMPAPELLANARAAAQASMQRVADGFSKVLPQLESAVLELMPMPTGLAGLSHDIQMLLGTDRAGRSILMRGLYSAKTAIQVGVVVALAAVLIGTLFGAAAGYFGGWTDQAVIWLYSTLSSLPQLVLLAVLAFMFLGSRFDGTLIPIYVALTLTFWIGTARVIRGEVLKIKELEYVQAGKAIGFSRFYILLRHIIPNTSHLMFIQFSLLFIGAVKTEVILTFLGLGIKDGASWGKMISDSQPEVINGFFWQIGAATVLMLVLVLAFNVLSDALQDAFDPKHVG